MKKIILTVATVFALTFANAQDSKTPELKSKRGENFLPVAGDWAIGFDATPFVDFAGGVAGGNGTSPTVDVVNKENSGKSLYAFAKYFKTDKIAYRAIANFVYLSNSADKYNKMTLIAGLGKEWRRGSTRLQGFYGVDGLFSFNKESIDGDEIKSESRFGIGARGFLGCEYFIIPKISIGLEYGYGVMVQSENSETYINLGGIDTGMSQNTFNNQANNAQDQQANWGSGHLNITFHF
jgi:hypothetical protein